MHIRNAIPDDVEQIYEVHDSNGESDEWDDMACCREQIEWMVQFDAASVVAEIDGKVVGEMKIWWGEDVPEFGSSLDVSTLYVHRDFHRRGIGSELIRWAARVSRQHGCGGVTVWPNEDSAAFYRKQGFEDGLVLREFRVDPSGFSADGDFEMRAVRLADIDPPAGRDLATHRILHPSQRWHDLVAQEADTSFVVDGERRSPILSYMGMSGRDLAVFRLFYWRNDPTRAELYLWSSNPTDAVLSGCIAQARKLGLRTVTILAYGKMTPKVAALCGPPQDGTSRVLVCRN